MGELDYEYYGLVRKNSRGEIIDFKEGLFDFETYNGFVAKGFCPCDYGEIESMWEGCLELDGLGFLCIKESRDC